MSTSLTRRVFDEYRRVITPLAAALVLNIAAYAFLVYPLAQRVANVAQRNQNAEQELAAARADYAQATGTVTGKTRAAAGRSSRVACNRSSLTSVTGTSPRAVAAVERCAAGLDGVLGAVAGGSKVPSWYVTRMTKTRSSPPSIMYWRCVFEIMTPGSDNTWTDSPSL